MARVSRGVSMLTSTTAIAQALAAINHYYDMMFVKRAFAHWDVSEGMEKEFFDVRERRSW